MAIQLLPLLLNAAVIGSSVLPLLLRGGKAVKAGAKAARTGRSLATPTRRGAFSKAAKKSFGKFGLGDLANLGLAGYLGYDMAKGPLIEEPMAEAAELEALFGGQFQKSATARALAEQRMIDELLSLPGDVAQAERGMMDPYTAMRNEGDMQALVDRAMIENQELLARAVERPVQTSVMDLYRQFGGV